MSSYQLFDKMPESRAGMIPVNHYLFPIPEFNGNDPQTWLSRANLYFKKNPMDTVDEWDTFEKVKYVRYFMFGPAEIWFEETFTDEPKENWECFCKKVLHHFTNRSEKPNADDRYDIDSEVIEKDGLLLVLEDEKENVEKKHALTYDEIVQEREEDEMYVLSARNQKVSVELMGKDKIQDKVSRFEELTSGSLAYLGVAFPGSPDSLSSTLPNLKGLDLSGNLLTKWDDVGIICEGLPALTSLNLSSNALSTDVTVMPQLRNIKILVLNHTGVTWKQVEVLKGSLPNIEELHLMGNNLSEITTESNNPEHGLEQLFLNNNNLSRLWYPDFSVRGVTSISVDIHKYGLAPKETSVVLYMDHDIQKYQFVAVTEWTGGLYVSPTIDGSRPGSLIAGAWAAMISLGLEGYLKNTRQIMEASKRIEKGVREVLGLFVVGKPDMTLVAFGSDIVDIFEVNDIMSSKGWHLNALQRPNNIHICVTLQHVPIVEEFLDDLRLSVETVKANPGPVDFVKNMDFWQQDKWSGCFPVKWHYVKDLPNPNFRHIILENNENKPVTNSRDTQEIPYKEGVEMLRIFKNYTSKTSLLDDFLYYENRQRIMQEERARLLIKSYENPYLVPLVDPPRKLQQSVHDFPSFVDMKDGDDSTTQNNAEVNSSETKTSEPLGERYRSKCKNMHPEFTLLSTHIWDPGGELSCESQP